MPEQVNSRMVNMPHNGTQTPGYLSHPIATGKRPGVVVIQEWWGLEPHIKDVVARFAGEGFAAVAPDLYHGAVAQEPDEARKLVMTLNREAAGREIITAVNYLKRQENCTGKVGVVGFCLGGGLSLLTACRGSGVSAAVVFYGPPLDPLDQVKNLECPLLGLYGEADQGIPVARARELEEKLKEHGKQVEFHIYPGAPHAFFNDARPSYRKEAAEDAWRRTLAFFRARLS